MLSIVVALRLLKITNSGKNYKKCTRDLLIKYHTLS